MSYERKGPAQYASELGFSDIEKQYGLTPGLLSAVMYVESRGNVNAVSNKGAVGPFQLLPATAARFGVTDPRDMHQSAIGAAKYLQFL